MRLIRTAAYVLLGYALFEMVSGMFDDPQTFAAGRAARDAENLTSPNRAGQSGGAGTFGRVVDTLDSDGAVSHVRVGSGVNRP